MKPLLVLVDQLTDWSPFYPTNQVIAIEQYLRDFAETRG